MYTLRSESSIKGWFSELWLKFKSKPNNIVTYPFYNVIVVISRITNRQIGSLAVSIIKIYSRSNKVNKIPGMTSFSVFP